MKCALVFMRGSPPTRMEKIFTTAWEHHSAAIQLEIWIHSHSQKDALFGKCSYSYLKIYKPGRVIFEIWAQNMSFPRLLPGMDYYEESLQNSAGFPQYSPKLIRTLMSDDRYRTHVKACSKSDT